MRGSNNLISFYRFVSDANLKEVYDTTPFLVDEPCYIEPMDAQVATMLDEQNAFYMRKIFMEGQLDVRIGDKGVDAQGKVYVVKGLEPFSNNPDTGDMTQLIGVLRFP